MWYTFEYRHNISGRTTKTKVNHATGSVFEAVQLEYERILKDLGSAHQWLITKIDGYDVVDGCTLSTGTIAIGGTLYNEVEPEMPAMPDADEFVKGIK